MEKWNEICRAEFRFQSNTKKVIIIGSILIVLGLLICILSRIPISVGHPSEIPFGKNTESLTRRDMATNIYNCFGEMIGHRYRAGNAYNLTVGGIAGLGAFIAGVMCAGCNLIASKHTKKQIENYTLLLHSQGIHGQNTRTRFDLPMQEIESITMKHDKTGKEIEICTGIETFVFPHVQNAEEFVQKALEEIKKWEVLRENDADPT